MTVAIVVGGSENVWEEFEAAKKLCPDREYFVINDMIQVFNDKAVGVTLHPDKLKIWIAQRNQSHRVSMDEIWSNRKHQLVNFDIRDWGGSSGLFACQVAREKSFTKILLCGVPMTIAANHFLRNQPWNACYTFKKSWEEHKDEIAPYVRSMSGWTADILGGPTREWLAS